MNPIPLQSSHWIEEPDRLLVQAAVLVNIHRLLTESSPRKNCVPSQAEYLALNKAQPLDVVSSHSPEAKTHRSFFQPTCAARKTTASTKTPSKKKKLPHLDLAGATEVMEIAKNDVLMGRGSRANNHPGNIRFRQLVRHFQANYIGLRKGKKTQLAKTIVRLVQERGGRFLILDESSSSSSGSGWKEIPTRRAWTKASQALREKQKWAHDGLTDVVDLDEDTVVEDGIEEDDK